MGPNTPREFRIELLASGDEMSQTPQPDQRPKTDSEVLVSSASHGTRETRT